MGKSAFPRTIRPHDRVDFTGFHREVHAAENFLAANRHPQAGYLQQWR